MKLFTWSLFAYAVATAYCYYVYVRFGLNAMLCVVMIYACCTAYAQWKLCQWNWLRQSAFLQSVCQLASKETTFIAPDPKQSRQHAYFSEPHEPVPFAFYATFGPTKSTTAVSNSVRLMAHSSFLAIPIIRDLYMALGVVPATESAFRRVVGELHQHIALIPSGIDGMRGALREEPSDVIKIYRKAHAIKSFKLAIEYKMIIIPHLSLNGSKMARCVTLIKDWPLLTTLIDIERPILRDGVKANSFFGNHLDASKYTSADKLANDYYNELMRMAHERNVQMIIITDYGVQTIKFE